MANAYEKWIQLAIRQITKYGRASAATFYRYTDSRTYDPATLSYSTDTLESVFTCLVAPVDYTLFQQLGYNIEQGNKLLYIPGRDTSDTLITPEVGYIVTLEKDYKVLKVIPYETQSVNVGYMLVIGDIEK